MPELPEVENVVRNLRENIIGLTIQSIDISGKSLRKPYPTDYKHAILNRKIITVKRRAKYIFITLDDERIIVFHLGMSGKLIISDDDEYKAALHDHVTIRLNDHKYLIFNDPRRFGLFLFFHNDQELNSHSLFNHLGPEPLEEAFNTQYLLQKAIARKNNIKNFIMDQQIVVGVGNIYAAEALYYAKINPYLIANELTLAQASELLAAIRKVLLLGIEKGGASLKDYVNLYGQKGGFQDEFQVYGRENKSCNICPDIISKTLINGRATYFCPNCQK